MLLQMMVLMATMAWLLIYWKNYFKEHSDIDLVLAIGPVPMMKAVVNITPLEIKTIVSLNALMVDWTGMCGVMPGNCKW